MLTSTKPDQISQPQSNLFTIWLAININKFTFIFNTCERKAGIIWRILGRMNTLRRNQTQRKPVCEICRCLLCSLIGPRYQWASTSMISSTGIYVFGRGGGICRGCHACVTQTMPVWCVQLCFTFHSHPYLPFPRLGLELNLNQGIFPQQCSCFLVFFSFLSFFVRDNSALHESSGPLYDSFECGFNRQPLDPPFVWLCKYSMSCYPPTLGIDKHSWPENFIFNNMWDGKKNLRFI